MKRLFSTGTPWIQFLRIRCWRWRIWMCKKRSPIFHVCPKCLAALLCGSAFLYNDLAFLQELDEVGVTLVDWQRRNFHCELIQHPENPLNRSYNKLHSLIPVSCQSVPIQYPDPRPIFFLQKCRRWNSGNSSILPLRWDFSELHVIPNLELLTAHEEVADLVVDVLLLERNEVLPAEIQQFHSIFNHFFSHN